MAGCAYLPLISVAVHDEIRGALNERWEWEHWVDPCEAPLVDVEAMGRPGSVRGTLYEHLRRRVEQMQWDARGRWGATAVQRSTEVFDLPEVNDVFSVVFDEVFDEVANRPGNVRDELGDDFEFVPSSELSDAVKARVSDGLRSMREIPLNDVVHVSVASGLREILGL